MLNFPVLVAAGGVNSAGRTSRRHAYRRMVWEHLDGALKAQTQEALAQMMGSRDPEWIGEHTLVREIEPDWFDHRAVPWQRRVSVAAQQGETLFEYAPGGMPEGSIRDGRVAPIDSKRVSVSLAPEADVLLPSVRQFEVSCAGQLPSGFSPGALYGSRNHPRALQMTVFALSDALADLGMEWPELAARIPADAVSVYVSSAMGQLDDSGYGGMLRARAQGRRVTSKQCPFGFAEMPGDFISAYMLQSFSATGPALGACATFLYNLRLGIEDIRHGRSRIAIVGAAEAPVSAEVMDGYIAMGALATDKGLRQLDGLSEDRDVNHRRACRPFGDNCGFTMAESAQVVILMDDALALELGAPILAGTPYVSVRADGAKKSISGPGAGNYLTVTQALAQVRSLLGEDRLRRGGLVQAHGTGTPQNRVTESVLLSRAAEAFGIHDWPIAAIKSYVGHSLAAAAGDQLTATLGIWQHGLIPRIHTIDSLAHDVATKHLAFALEVSEGRARDYALINSKGFGGNNATAALLSPSVTEALLEKAHGTASLTEWRRRRELLEHRQQEIESSRLAGNWHPVYRFDDGVQTDEDVEIEPNQIRIGGRTFALESQVPDNWRLGAEAAATDQ